MTNLTLSSILNLVPKVQKIKQIQGKILYLFPGNSFFLGMGCKFFRFYPYLFKYQETLKEHPNAPVKLGFHGNIHSNYLAAMAYFSYQLNIPHQIIGYNRYHNQDSGNSILVRKFSKELKILTTMEYKNFYFDPTNILWVPSYGFDLSYLGFMDSFWDVLDWENYTHIVMDLGSGMSFFSLVQYFENKKIYKNLIGVAIGADVNHYLELYKKFLKNFKKNIGLNIQFWEPFLGKKFYKPHKILVKYTYEKSKEGIYLEPMYSAKTFLTIEKNWEQFPKKSKILYIHQGGNLNWVHCYFQ